MRRTAWLALLAAASATACAQPTPEQQILNDAADALGGRARIEAVKTLVLEGEGRHGNLGQDMTPDATGQSFTVTAFKRSIDVVGGRMKVEQTRTPAFPHFQGPAPQTQVFGVDVAAGYNVAPNGTASRVPELVASERRAEILHHPITIVRAALDPNAKVGSPRMEGNEHVLDVTTTFGQSLTLAVDATMKLPTRVTSTSYHPNLGDVVIETTFTGYQDVGGLQVPNRFTTKTDGYTTADMTIARHLVDADVGDLAAPSAAASAAPITGPPPVTVTAEEVAKGVWLLAGQSHHSVLVEFADHLTLIEAPQSEARALAVIAKARELRPDKPLTHVVATHHHFDHSAGVRAAVSEGLTIITQGAAAAFYRAAASRPHTIVADVLSRTPRQPSVESVDDELVLEDATMRVNLYRIVESPHADTLLMAYFPRERLLVEADVFTPGSPVHVFAPNLLENIKRRNLRVDRIVPIHGQVVPFAELVKAAQSSATN